VTSSAGESTLPGANVLQVGVIFGGRSMEHGVSVLTAHQVAQALNRARYKITAIYISERGEWFAGDRIDDVTKFKGLPLDASEFERAFAGHSRRAAIVPDRTVGGLLALDAAGLLRRAPQRTPLDVVVLALHGSNGEDGTVQGLLELAGIPYTSAGVLGSALGMDKAAMKDVWRSAGLPVVPYLSIDRFTWEADREQELDRIIAALQFPIFVKPSSLGSSIGISRAVNREDLGFAIDVAAAFDRRLLVEQGLENATDINCAVLGNDKPIASPCERPLMTGAFLSYDDKYLRGKAGKSTAASGMEGMQRELPAQIPLSQSEQIQELAIRAFEALDCSGIARVDFLVGADGAIYLNEINTIPGSLSSYLWEAIDIDFSDLLDRLIQLGIDRARDKRRSRYSATGN
jgi:D-alanine-D-alanine ligase